MVGNDDVRSSTAQSKQFREGLEQLLQEGVVQTLTVKDSGRTIPGIGGALDLIDSILFTAPVLYFYLEFTAAAKP